jgi:hypothetical protein
LTLKNKAQVTRKNGDLTARSAQPLEQFRHFNLETLGNFLNAAKGKIPLAPLGLSDVGPMEPGGLGHLLL